ncbi:MAG: diacylglycerol kinase [Desulfuromonadales bacterium]|nr:diacylglycerol kinase [Desulfuromonadales bacterium]
MRHIVSYDIDRPAEEQRRGFDHFIHAFSWSMKGFVATYRFEAAFRQELFFCIILVPVALWLGETGTERALMVASLLLVLIVEIINSAIESIVNRIGIEHHQLSGRAKDQGSAAVFLSLLLAAFLWALILLPKFGS